MKPSFLNFKILLFILIMAAFSAFNPSKSQEKKDYGEATKALIEIVENNPEVKSMLVSSLEIAQQINPDKKTNPAQSLEEYFKFVSHCERSMPWDLLQETNYNGLLSQTSQSLIYFYFLLDQPLPELEGKGNYKNTLQYAEPIASWLITFDQSWARFLETEASWNEEYYQMALEDPAFGLHKGWYEDPSNWKTFNQFFARHLKSPDQRPIASPDDPSVVAAFADSRPQGVWDIDGNSEIISKEGVPVKSARVQSIPSFRKRKCL
ncbi:phosphatidylserine decarboxylase [Echinicola jeungdonensis]|uniref:phosphatidylserine decarboxylase n=1 Tax=Echinicola jeungdonensis TaxID=709343 RepID=UPI0025B5AA4B|nr:phosphatidylserine decarboxylase [Echinicola jeungdonensis]MDN3671378.1 phosphatidylserine decarboxylase [Echinicola jeungdonensis]